MYYAHLNSERGERWKFKLSEKINNTVKVQLFKNSPLMGLEVWPSFSPQYLHHHHHGSHLHFMYYHYNSDSDYDIPKLFILCILK